MFLHKRAFAQDAVTGCLFTLAFDTRHADAVRDRATTTERLRCT